MGTCCHKLDTIEHANTLEDMKGLVENQIDFHTKSHKNFSQDKVIFPNLRIRKRKIKKRHLIISNSSLIT